MYRLQQLRALVPLGPSARVHVHRSRLAAVAAGLAAGITALVWGIGSFASGAGPHQSALSSTGAKAKAERAYGKLPLRFEANRGQTDSRVNFTARGAGYTLFLSPREAVLSLVRGTGREKVGSVLRMRLLGARPHPRVVGLDPLSGTTSYLKGSDRSRWRTGVPGYGRVRYREVYPGVDLLYHGRQGALEYDFALAPGADPAKIALGFGGATRLALDRGGSLVARTRAGTVREPRPVLYQEVGGQRRAVSGAYVLHRGHRVGFRVGRYDRSRPLVIDPELAYSTYLGGSTGASRGSSVAADSSGAAYVAGSTSAVDFPVSSQAFDKTRGGDPTDPFADDAFVTKLDPAGALVYSTYLGGGASDNASGIAVDSSGRAYVTGTTSASDFPTTGNAFQSTPPAPAAFTQQAFMSVLKDDGSGLVYSTYLGSHSSLVSGGGGIAVDSSKQAYITGSTSASDFPTKAPTGATPFQASPGDTVGAGDAFVTKLNPDALTGPDSLVYSTYLGGEGYDSGAGIAVDGSGNAYLTGNTYSTNFPTKAPFQRTAGGNGDPFVAKLNPTGSALAYSTYLGGSAADSTAAIALDPTGHAYVTGSTKSTDFPVTNGAFQTQHAGDPANDGTQDAFVTKLDTAASSGSSLVYSSYLGGVGDDAGGAIAVTASGTAYVAGAADTENGAAVPGSFPTVDPVAPVATRGDVFVSAVKPDGSGLSFSTYLGGGAEEDSFGAAKVAVDPSGNAYVSGTTLSTDFPTHNPFQAENAGRAQIDHQVAFVAKLAPVAPAAPLVTGLGHRSGPARTSVVISGHGFASASAVRFGTADASSFTVDSDTKITATAPPGPSGPVGVTVTTPQGTSPPANPIATFTYAQGTWDPTGSLRVVRLGALTETLLSDGRVLVAGGRGTSGERLDSAELYDPSTETWRTTQSMGTIRSDSTATLLSDGRVLVAGGLNADSVLDSAELYDPTRGTWTPTGSMTQTRLGHTATLLANGKVLVTGSYSPTTSAELYDPATEKWGPAGSLHDARNQHTATLLATGKVLVAGGSGDSGLLASAELYDPGTDSWTTTGSLDTARNGHTATRLGDGRVLVAGGAASAALASAEVYDPASGTFSQTSAMEHPRAGAAAALLSDGRVLVAGGSQDLSKHNTAELYDSATGRWSSAGLMVRYRGFEGSAQLVFALPLASGRVLVGGDPASAGATTELYNPAGPGSPPPGPGPGTGSNSSGLTSSGTTAGGADRTAPVVSGYGITNNPFVVGGRTPTFGSAARRRHKKGTTFRYTLSENATVRIVIAQGRTGRRRGKRCVAPTRRLRHARKCIRLFVKGTLTRTSHKGANSVGFSGRIGSKALKPGHYQATLTATDAAKNASRPKTITFTVVKR